HGPVDETKGEEPVNTPVRGLTAGPTAVITAASAKLPGGSKNGHDKGGRKSTGEWLRARASEIPETFVRLGRPLPGVSKKRKGVARRAVGRIPKLVERTAAVVGVAAAGMELVRELRSGGPDGRPNEQRGS